MLQITTRLSGLDVDVFRRATGVAPHGQPQTGHSDEFFLLYQAKQVVEWKPELDEATPGGIDPMS